MNLAQLQEQQQKLALQRSAHKEQIEGIDKALGQVSFAIQVLEKQEPEDLRTELERLADEEAEASRMSNLD